MLRSASRECDFFGVNIDSKFVHKHADDWVNLSVYSGLSASSSSRNIEREAAVLAVAL
jgi:hypothetical protein